MSTGPTPSKSRLPKPYTDAELGFLKSHLDEFDRRTQGSVRGDAKKFALEKANEFVATFGLPQEFRVQIGGASNGMGGPGLTIEEAEGRFREQIYNWFKNTIGRTRRKMEGRPRAGAAKKLQGQGQGGHSVQSSPSHVQASHSQWQTNVASPTTSTNGAYDAKLMTSSPTQTAPSIPQTTATNYYGHTVPHAHPVAVQPTTLADAFMQRTEQTLASLILATLPATHLQLDPTIKALFHASQTPDGSPHSAIRLLLNTAQTYFGGVGQETSPTVTHAGVSGPSAATIALQMHIRRNSIWISSSEHSEQLSVQQEMQRVALDRQRKKDFVTWARIHAAAIDIGLMTPSPDGFSELIARDAVWANEEVEWVAGIYILAALIRAPPSQNNPSPNPNPNPLYDELLREYELRWRDIRDETRQVQVAEVLLAARDDVQRMHLNRTQPQFHS